MTLRVLVADDDLLTRKVLATVLDLEGHEVVLAEDGTAAWELLGQGGVDVAVLDHDMPGVTGLELLRRLRAQDATATLPVVLLTGVVEAAPGADPIELGAQAVIAKPFSPLHLVDVLDQVTGVRS